MSVLAVSLRPAEGAFRRTHLYRLGRSASVSGKGLGRSSNTVLPHARRALAPSCAVHIMQSSCVDSADTSLIRLIVPHTPQAWEAAQLALITGQRAWEAHDPFFFGMGKRAEEMAAARGE